MSLGGTSTINVAAGTALTILSVIGSTDSTDSLTKTGAGTLTLTAANTYMGYTTINAGTVVLSSANGAATFSAFTVNTGGTLILDDGNTPGNNTRLDTLANLTLAGGELRMLGSSSGNATENFGTLTLASGSSTVTVSQPGSTYFATLSGTDLFRLPGATVLFRGTKLGTGSNGSANIMFGNAPYSWEIGNGTTANRTNLQLNTHYAPILPWALGSISANGTGFASSNAYPGKTGFDGGFVTYDPTTGIRLLNNSEYRQPIDGVPFTSAQYTGENVFLHGGAYTINNGTTETWNSVLIPTNGGYFNNACGCGTLTLSSGAISIGDGNYGMGLTALDFGNAEGIISIGNNDLAMTLIRCGNTVSTVIEGSGGITKTGPNRLTITTGNNTYTGTTTVAGGALVLNNANATNTSSITVSGSGSLINNAGTVANDDHPGRRHARRCRRRSYLQRHHHPGPWQLIHANHHRHAGSRHRPRIDAERHDHRQRQPHCIHNRQWHRHGYAQRRHQQQLHRHTDQRRRHTGPRQDRGRWRQPPCRHQRRRRYG